MFSFKKILIVLIPLVLVFAMAGFALAQRELELRYPEIPGAIRPASIRTDLAEFIKYVFYLALLIAGLICFGSLVYGGIRYLTSAGSPEAMGDAKSQITAGLLGIVILFSAYLISTTINPQLVILHVGIEAVGGFTIGSEPCEGNELRGETRNITGNVPNFGFDSRSLKFISRPEELAIILYSEVDYKGSQTRLRSTTQDCINMGGERSAKLFFELAGAYLCTGTYADEKCNGEEKYLPASTALLEPGFNDKVKGLRLKGGTMAMGSAPVSESILEYLTKKCIEDFGGIKLIQIGTEYLCVLTESGAVLHEAADFSGQCEVFLETDNDLTSGTNPFTGKENLIENKTSSVTTFVKGEPGTGDEGVWLCDAVDADRKDCYGPFQEEEVSSIQADKGINDATISSIIIDGNYMAILFDDLGFGGTCEVFTPFTEGMANLRSHPIGRCHCIFGNWGCGDCLSSFIVLPTK